MAENPEESRHPLGSEEREVSRENARVARERAERLITECARLMAELERSVLSREARRSAVDESRSALEKGVLELAECLRGVGAPPERAIAIVKEIAEDALRDIDSKPRFSYQPPARELRADVVRWMINGYYSSMDVRDPLGH